MAARGKTYYSDIIFVNPGTVVTANGNSTPIGAQFIRQARRLLLGVTVSAASGTTPTVTPVLQTSLDGTNYGTMPGGSVGAITTTGTTLIAVQGPFGPQLQIAYTAVGGTTPSFTLGVRGVLQD